MELELETIVASIEGENACGVDLREDSSPTAPFYLLKDVRNSARRKEREYTDESEDAANSVSDWEPILSQVPELLANQSKDLELTAWYIEALLRYYGFEGLTYGFKLAAQLIKDHQEGLFPQDEDGLETTLGPLIGLNGVNSDGALITPIKSVPLFFGQTTTYCAWQYEQAIELEKITDEEKKEARIRNGAITLADISQAVKECPAADLKLNYEALLTAKDEYAVLVEQIDALAKGEFMPTSNIKKALEMCETAFLDLASDKVVDKAPETESTEEVVDEQTGEIVEVVDQGVMTREKALDKLAEIAEFFREKEPHSPISYSLEQAIRWSQMELPELLNELIPDAGSRSAFHKFTGINEENS